MLNHAPDRRGRTPILRLPLPNKLLPARLLHPRALAARRSRQPRRPPLRRRQPRCAATLLHRSEKLHRQESGVRGDALYFGQGAVEFRFGVVSGESELGGPEGLYALGEGGVVGSVEGEEGGGGGGEEDGGVNGV